MRRKLLTLLKVSRLPLWPALPVVFCMGLAYGQAGMTDPAFRFTTLMLIQMFMLGFPICLFIFGLNDIHDYASDQLNPRKRGIEGTVLESGLHSLVRKAALASGALFLFFSLISSNLLNLFFAVTLLVVSYTYSVPPWRLKIRPPLDVISGGLIGFFAPFGLGYSFAADVAVFPPQALYFTFCVMGFHAFSTITDYEVDRRSRDRTFAVAYGKRTAALFPAVIFLPGPYLVHMGYIKVFFVVCLALFILMAVYPSEKMARYVFPAVYLGAVLTLAVWTAPYFFS